MATHRANALQIGSTTVWVVWGAGRLYVPMRQLIDEVLQMTWSAQAAKLKAMQSTGAVRALDVRQSERQRPRQELCLRASRLSAYLAALRPTRARSKAALAHLREYWDEALIGHLKVDPGVFPERGGYLAPLLEDQQRLEQSLRSARERIAELEQALKDKPAEVVNVLASPIQARWGKVMTKEKFIAMVELEAQGVTRADIARQMECSRTTVSLFLDGKYQAGAAKLARAELIAAGWSPGSGSSAPVIVMETDEHPQGKG